jgi:glycosyltransferase involved in cell wall biosynthesis
MGSYNGSKYIGQQLESFASQTHANWRLVVSDDGSTDDTLAQIEQHTQAWAPGQLTVRQGPRQGFCHNFLSMACDTTLQADMYAFSDQDDVWLPNKLQVAVEHIQQHARPEQPYVYCGRTTYVRDNLKPYEQSTPFVYPRSFRNALIQSIAGGNTMVFNQAAKKLIEQAGMVPTVSHDWWLYQLVTGAGGRVFYDPTSYILYRQHSAALVGGNTTLLARAKRIFLVFQGRFELWTDRNIEALNQARDLLTPESREILDLFVRLRRSKLAHRFRMIEVCGLYRQTWRGTISLIVAAVFKKI